VSGGPGRVEKRSATGLARNGIVHDAGCECNLIRLAPTVVADPIPGSVGGWGATVQGTAGAAADNVLRSASRNYGPVLRG
jgi:hypothetical protein